MIIHRIRRKQNKKFLDVQKILLSVKSDVKKPQKTTTNAFYCCSGPSLDVVRPNVHLSCFVKKDEI